MGNVILIRHGQTEWSRTGRHTSTTDLDLTDSGEQQARALAGGLTGRAFAAVYSSPRLRARRTAELAGLDVTDVVDTLAEWDYGHYEGLTTPQIRQDRPDWSLWTDGCPGGESPEQVTARLDRFLDAAAGPLRDGDVAVFSHGHASRALAARWLGLPVAFGAQLSLDTATLSVLGHEHERRSLRTWNAPVS